MKSFSMPMRAPSVEVLESRITPGSLGGVVTVSYANGVLTLAGDAANNSLLVTDLGFGSMQFSSSGTTFEYLTPEIGGSPTQFSAPASFTKIKIKLDDGADDLVIATRITGALDVDTGDGDDIFELADGAKITGKLSVKVGNGDDDVLLGSDESFVKIVGSTKVDLGTGGDFLQIGNARVIGSVSLKSSSDLTAPGVGTLHAPDEVSVSNTLINGRLSYAGSYEGTLISMGQTFVLRDALFGVKGSYEAATFAGAGYGNLLLWDLQDGSGVGGNLRLVGTDAIFQSSQFSETFSGLDIGGSLLAKGVAGTVGGEIDALRGSTVMFELSDTDVSIGGNIVLSDVRLDVASGGGAGSYSVGGSVVGSFSSYFQSSYFDSTTVSFAMLGELNTLDIAGNVKLKGSNKPPLLQGGELSLAVTAGENQAQIGGSVDLRAGAGTATLGFDANGLTVAGKTTITSQASAVSINLDRSLFIGAFTLNEGATSGDTLIDVASGSGSSVGFGGPVTWNLGGGDNVVNVALDDGFAIFAGSWTVAGGGTSSVINYAPSRITESIAHVFTGMTSENTLP